MRLALAGLVLVAAVVGGTTVAKAHDRYRYYYGDPYPPRVRYVPPPRVYYPPPPPVYYAPAPIYVVPRPVPYGYYPVYPAYRPYAPPAAASFSFIYRGH
jgi:hypothetical protein